MVILKPEYMSYVRNWIHIVWGTKNRMPFLKEELLNKVTDHIRANAREKNIFIDSINGHLEHIHCLISLNPDISLSMAVQLLKGESSHWINKNKLTRLRFGWAVDYYGGSVCHSHLDSVRNYIRNQQEHHKIQTWVEENESLVNEMGLMKIEG